MIYSDRRSPAEKQARNNFVNAWQKVDPDAAPFLGNWLGYEVSWNIHPSDTKGQVCIMIGIFGAMYIEMGRVVDGNIYTETGGVIFKEGDYLGVAARSNSGLVGSSSPRPFRHPTALRKPVIYEDIKDRYQAERVIQEYEQAGCTASLPGSSTSTQSRKPTAAAIEQARTQFKAKLRSLENNHYHNQMSSFISNHLSPEQKQAQNNFVNAWQKVNPAIAPFLGSWVGNEEQAWGIHPSNKPGKVCLIKIQPEGLSLEIGTVTNNSIYQRG